MFGFQLVQFQKDRIDARADFLIAKMRHAEFGVVIQVLEDGQVIDQQIILRH